MSKKISPPRARVEIPSKLIYAVAFFFAAVTILTAPASAQEPYPGGYEISGYVTYGVYGLPGVWVIGVGTGDSTGYLGLDVTDSSGYYNIPVPEGFAGNVEPSKDGYTFDPSSRSYSNVVSDMMYQNFAASNGSPPTPPALITVTYPNGGESWQRGTAHEITWDSVGDAGSNVKIELYIGGALNRTINHSTSNDGSYVWLVPLKQDVASDCRIKITSTANSSYNDYSDNDYSIIELPRITVSSPNGGESWQRGTSHEIAWDSVGDTGTDVKIELYRTGLPYLKIIGSTDNDGAYDWTVPPDLSIDSYYTVKITSTSNPALFDESDDYFSINEVSPVLFEDTFPSQKIDIKKWIVVSDVTVDDMGIDEPTPDYSLRFNGHPSGGDLIESEVIDLSSYAGVTLTYYYQRTGPGNSPEQGEDLVIEYYDGFSWVELDRRLGDGPDMENYEEVIIPLPAGSLHAGFRFRIMNTGTASASHQYDDWFVDDVKIEVTEYAEDDDDIIYPVKLIADDGDYDDWFGRRVSIRLGIYIRAQLYGLDTAGKVDSYASGRWWPVRVQCLDQRGQCHRRSGSQ